MFQVVSITLSCWLVDVQVPHVNAEADVPSACLAFSKAPRLRRVITVPAILCELLWPLLSADRQRYSAEICQRQMRSFTDTWEHEQSALFFAAAFVRSSSTQSG